MNPESKKTINYIKKDDTTWDRLEDFQKQSVSIAYKNLVIPIIKSIEGELDKIEAKIESINEREPTAITEIDNVQEFIDQNKLAIIDFTAEWCIPCYYYQGPLERTARKDNEIAIAQIDINKHPETSKWFNGKAAIPLLLGFREGEIIHRVTGSVKGQKAYDTLKWMSLRLKVDPQKFDKKLQQAKKYAEKMGWKLNPNQGVRDGLIAALVHSKYCPCKTEKIPENICPCRPVENKYPGAKEMIKERGTCYCGLFVSPELIKSSLST